MTGTGGKIIAAIFLFFIISSAICLYALERINTRPENTGVSLPSGNDAAKEKTVATRVIDGDTIVVEGGKTVRLLGIDTDEKNYPCYEAARTRLEDLVLGKAVTLEPSLSDTDRYGRLLRYVFVGEQNTSLTLVGEGLAVALLYPDNRKYREEIMAAENEARLSKTGCKWSGQFSVQEAGPGAFTSETDARAELMEKNNSTNIEACEADNYIGRYVSLTGLVVEAKKTSGGTVFLNFKEPYPNNCFTAVIFPSSLSEFADPEIVYLNKIVEVSGSVKEYEGKAEVILDDPSQIRIIGR
jgi:micrococcal nuclease